MDKKKLKNQYKQMKPDMGVFMFMCKPTGKRYLGYGQNTKGDINSIRFQLKFGSYPTNSNLQNDWKEHGEDSFEITVLELLQYDKDETKSDYTDDLRLLRKLCSEKFTNIEYINN